MERHILISPYESQIAESFNSVTKNYESSTDPSNP